MQPFTTHTGKVVAMDRANVDTDQIIPKQFLKRIERKGFGQFLFYDWRYHEDGSHNVEFELNHPKADGATILLARSNFGCGSSREHAPWALEDHGFRVLISSSFADIFYNNCFKNGILPIKLPHHHIDQLFESTAKHPEYSLTADLEKCEVTDEHGLSISFEVASFHQHCLLNGLDDIGLTLEHEEEIAAYEAKRGIGA